MVGETIFGMIERCDDSVKAEWLSKLFYELVLKRNFSRLFMRTEKALSSLSVMDLEAFLKMPLDHYNCISEEECEPFIGSGLYLNPKYAESKNGDLNLDDTYCEATEIGHWIYRVLNDNPILTDKPNPMF